MKNNFIVGSIRTDAGEIPLISTNLSGSDYLGVLLVRTGFSRDDYKIEPGIYAVGEPTDRSDVFVSANYKLSFDILRKNLTGVSAWILVLDTKGVNVWCAAGKGTFGTEELVRRINLTSLDKIVKHKRIILPQLGAVGVAAHIVKERTGFLVLFGPVRAMDIRQYIASGYKASNEMRRIRFTFYDRLKLIPVDFLYRKYYLLATLILLLIISGFGREGVSFSRAIDGAWPISRNVLLAYFSGMVITPMLLPYIPGRSFSFKGFFIGVIVSVISLWYNLLGIQTLQILSWFFIISAFSSFLAMNFTGSSTYTSLSGVKKEMKVAMPLQISFFATGLAVVVLKNIL